MNYTPKYIERLFTQHQSSSLIVLFVVALASFFLAQFFGMLVAFVLCDLNFEALNMMLENPQSDPSNRSVLLAVQAVSSLIMFVATPLLYLRFYERTLPSRIIEAEGKKPFSLMLLITFVIVLAYMPFSAFVIQWNEAFVFPEWMAGFAQKAREMEDAVKELTEFLVQFDSPFEFLIGLLIIAVLPGVGEELLFRGVLQNKLSAITKNTHLAIWISAILFSAVHFQFFGFVPRMLLGALFGYLYIWSGTIWVPMFAHFCNNGITLLAFYLNQQNMTEIDIQQTEAVTVWWALGSLAIVALLLYIFKNLPDTVKNKIE